VVTPANFLKLRGLGFLERPRQVEKALHVRETRRWETRMETQLIRFLRFNTPPMIPMVPKFQVARIVNSNERQFDLD
jgi:hypothetical protein